jgi:hypothetical protein
MLIGLEGEIERERYRDLQREAEWERLIGQARVGPEATCPQARLSSRIVHLAGWFRADRRRPHSVSSSKRLTAV